MLSPIILAVDDDAAMLAQLRRDLGGRYGADYEVITEPTARDALVRLEQLQGMREIALLIADQWMPAMTGVEFLTRAHDLCPGAKRTLLIDLGDQSAAEPILRAATLGRIDYYLTKPWTPADDQLHPLITELLAEWTRAHRPRAEMVQVVGDRWEARSHELRDLLDRNAIPYGFYECGSEEGKRLLRNAHAGAEQTPVVILRTGAVLVQPSNVDVAGALGVRTSAPSTPYDLAIIGAGPAGLAAAVYGTSEGLRTVVVECEALGGQAGTSSLIRNYLGFPRGLSGAELTQRAYQQSWLFGTEFIFMQGGTGLRSSGNDRIVTLGDGSEITARAVILATGVSYRRIGIPSIDSLLGAGVFYGAASAEAKAMTDQEVAVVGAGNSAGQAALHLAKYAARVTMLVRGESLDASMSDYLVREIERTENIAIRLRTEVIGGRGEHRLEGLVLGDRTAGETEEVPASPLFILIGATPKTDWLGQTVARDERGFIPAGPDLLHGGQSSRAWDLSRPPFLLETSMPGVFAAGDVRHGSVKRVASAVGEGSIAISFVHQYLAG